MTFKTSGDADVTIPNVPAFVGGIERAAAGELGHGCYQSAPARRNNTTTTGAPRAAGAHDQADQDTRDHVLSLGAS
jgi:hypothetical protein